MFEVLVVDDDVAILDLTKEYLIQTGDTNVDIAESAVTALRIAERKGFDVIVSDQQMKGMSGIELLKALRERNDRTPFILFTSQSNQEVAVQALNYGADSFIHKGCGNGLRELQDVVRKLAEKHRSEGVRQQDLKRGEHVYAELPVGICIFNNEGVLVDLNETASKILGIENVGQSGGLNIFRDIDLSDEAKRRIKRGESIIYSSVVDLDRLRATKGGGAIGSGLIYLERMIARLDGSGGRPEGYYMQIRETSKVRHDESLFRNHAFLGENLHDAIIATDVDLAINSWDTAAERLFNLRAEDVLGKCLKDVFSTGSMHPHLFRSLIDQGHVVGEIEYQREGGRRLIVEVNAVAIKDHIGDTVGYMVIVRDISDRKAAEEKLRHSEEMLRSILMHSPDAITLFDMSGKIVECNSKAMDISGCSAKDQIVGQNMLETIAPEERQCMIDNMREMIANGNVNHLEYTLLKSNGQRYFAEVTSWAVKDAKGEPELLVAMTKDVTQTKLAEEELRKSRARMQEAQHIARFGYWERDMRTMQDHWSDEVFEILGYRPGSFVPSLEKMLQHIHPEDREKMVKTISPETATGDYRDIEFRALRADGCEIWLHNRSCAVLDAFGRKTMVVGTVQDVTERRIAESTIQLSNRKMNLLGAVTRHDVMNMLTVLQGNLELAAALATDEKMKKYISRSRESTRIIEKQMEYTRSYEALGAKGFCWIDVANVVRMNVSSLPLNNITVNIELDGLELYTDNMFERAVYNILDNSLRHGQKVSSINVRCREMEGDLKLLIEDNGVGVAAADKELIFRRGFGKNTGLGLNLTKEILGITGISIREIGVPGEGAVFEITVPQGHFRVNGCRGNT